MSGSLGEDVVMGSHHWGHVFTCHETQQDTQAEPHIRRIFVGSAVMRPA